MEITQPSPIKDFKLIGKMPLLIIIVAIIAGSLYFYTLKSEERGEINQDGWQAVFLDNDQVYFGKLTVTSDFYVLKKIYYLQTEEENDQLNNLATKSFDGETSKDKELSRKLVKLGNELHGPEDTMFIEKSKVLFWENMKSVSTIVQSINLYEREKGN